VEAQLALLLVESGKQSELQPSSNVIAENYQKLYITIIIEVMELKIVNCAITNTVYGP
jgi:hypothetical protein